MITARGFSVYARIFRFLSIFTDSKTEKAIVATVSAVFIIQKKLRSFCAAHIRPISRLIIFISILVYSFHVGLDKRTAWAIDGILSPCSEEVGDISAPVATKRTRDSSPLSSRRIIYEFKTEAPQPQPEPPA